MKTLTASIVIPNITKWKVAAFTAHLDDSPAWGEIVIQFQGNGGIAYVSRTLPIFDSQDSMCVLLNAAPTSYLGYVTTTMKTIANAFTTVFAATATGNRNAQLQAIEVACLTLGIVDASLASA